MDPAEFEQLLVRTFDDRQLSRGERRVLGEVLAERAPTPPQLALLRSRAFALAREAASTPAARQTVEWLEEIVKTLAPVSQPERAPEPCSVYFSPGEECPRKIVDLFGRARVSVDICVFTITDDRICEAILAAHKRGVGMRIITDNDKACDPGSDVDRLCQGGLAVCIDRSDFHMHHKFAIFDARVLLTGSYNWTRGAARDNEENFLVTSDPELRGPYAAQFDKLWRKLSAS